MRLWILVSKYRSPLHAAKRDSIVCLDAEFAFLQAVGAGEEIFDDANALICSLLWVIFNIHVSGFK